LQIRQPILNYIFLLNKLIQIKLN